MAAQFSTFYSDEILDNIFNGGTFVFPTALWVAAFNSGAQASLRTNTTATWYTKEVPTSGTAYARIPIMAATGITFTISANGIITNQGPDIVWAQALASWGTVYTIALVTTSAANTGNCLAYVDLDTPRVIEAPDVLSIPTGALDITL